MTSHLPAHALALFIISRQDDADAAAFMRGVGLKPLTLEVNPTLVPVPARHEKLRALTGWTDRTTNRAERLRLPCLE